MAFGRPTLQELVTRIEGDFKSGLGILTLLRRSFIKVLARVLAGLSHSLFGFLAYIEKQAFPDTAGGEYLKRWGSIWDVPPLDATFAEFTADVTGTSGVTIPANRAYRRGDGAEYETAAEVTLSGPTGVITLVAVASGRFSRMEPGDVLTIVSPIAGLDNLATVDTVLTIAEDAESEDSHRQRLIDRIQNPPSGGAPNDYIQWAREVPGVTRAWVGPQALGPGTVIVYFVTDGEDPITPSAPKIQEVIDYLEDNRRPATANVSVVAPTLLDLDLTIAIKPNNAATQEAITEELLDLIFRDAALSGAYKSPGVFHDGKILLSRMREAVSIAVGEEDHDIILVNGLAPADVEPATGELVVLGAITWQTLA